MSNKINALQNILTPARKSTNIELEVISPGSAVPLVAEYRGYIQE